MIIFKEKNVVISNYIKLAPVHTYWYIEENNTVIDIIQIFKEVPLIVSSITGLTVYNAMQNDAYEQWCESIIFSNSRLFSIMMDIINSHLNGTAIIIYDGNDINSLNIIEMLSKVITNRYGIICWNVAVPEDEDAIKDDGYIDPFKIRILDIDIRRYNMMLNNM